ncbi:MAG: CCA tRNA nucleotidyltransferase [Rhodobacteraceae bacterium]|nr:CCA tRNA nucleotidyltransferase [Paracoccaceae bacterium]
MKLRGNWLTRPATQAVFEAIESGGHQIWAVGGCVRDDLLGVPVRDIDLATNAMPDQVTALAEVAGVKAIPTGIDHGTMTLVSAGTPYEVTTFRSDVDTHGRRATVAFGASLEEDAKRRDFTMNALYADRTGAVLDPVHGLPDLRARRVRFVGDADARVLEDYLRILRFFRFTALYGDPANGIDADGLAACAAGAEGLEAVSRERIGAEMKKLLGAADPAPAAASMQMSGVLMRVLPGADGAPLAVLVHHERAVGAEPDPLRRLAALGGAEPVTALRLSRAEAKQLELLRTLIADSAGLAETAWRHGEGTARDVALLRVAMLGGDIAPDHEAQIAAGATATCPVTAKDLMPAFSGPALGAKLAEVEARWIASGFALDKAALLG